jgi:hypothetical protein
MAKSYFIKLNEVKRSLFILNIKRASFISARLVFYRRFYNLNKIYRLSYLIINKVYK